MSSSNYRVRRATVDDLNTLNSLWSSMNLPVGDLKNRLTEFQVAEDASGKVVGTVGFQILQRHGLIHSEAFADFSVADQVRPLLWGRIQALAMNHGIARLWTRENAPFWTHNGLQSADAAAMARLPEAWNRASAGWRTLRLKDEDVMLSADKEFDMFVASERARSEEAMSQAKVLKTVLTIVSLILCAALLGWGVYMYFHNAPVSSGGP